MDRENLTMKPEAQRETVLFTAALGRPPAQRAAFLDGACLGDAALRQRLEVLFAAHEQTDGAFAEPAPPGGTVKIECAEVPDETVGQKIGRYKILEKIGEGGCGVVYVAEQTEPVRRRVALKVIKLGMDTKAVVARFDAERQALAMMDHPNIAKVFDAGTTDTGRPYFIMELVRGIRITDYCDQNKLSTNERVDLFIKICQAIQHAHQKGIIHRDIKPSNILVTLHDGEPVPKVIDFGIAKATEGRLTDATVYTQLHQFIGTPAYMSPEQAEMSGLDIDTRSDIYSLGVLLYELLTGKTPFDAQELMSQGIDAMRKTIREKDPMRPSTKLATLKGEELTTTAKRRSVETSKLAKLLTGDLDWIVMKCLEKNRTRRYETANGLATDLKRHLNNETVIARPPSSAYRFQKLARRNKAAVGAVGAVVCALVLGIIAASWQAVRATHAKREALVAREQAETNEAKALAAQANEAKQKELADAARANETLLRQKAVVAELAARRKAYGSDMNLVQLALAQNNLGRAQEILDRQRPQPGQQDLRGWEWRYLWQQCRSDALYSLCQISNEITSLSVSHDGQWLAIGTGFRRGPASVLNLQTHQEFECPAEDGAIERVTFSPQNSYLAMVVEQTNSQDQLKLWDVTTRKIVSEFPMDGVCRGLAFTADGSMLVTESQQDNGQGHITVWQSPKGHKISEYSASLLDFGASEGTHLAVAQNGGIAAFVEATGKICVIDLATGKQMWTAKATDDTYVMCLAFSPDGKVLASSSGFVESDIRLWDVATGHEIRRLEGHRAWVGSLVFWPDGRTLASASGDQTIRLWDLRDIHNVPPPRVLRGHKLEVLRIALMPDNTTLVSGSKDGSVLVWDTSADHSRHEFITLPDEVDDWRFALDGSLVTVKSNVLTRWTGVNFQQKESLPEWWGQAGAWVLSSDCMWVAVVSSNNIVQVRNEQQGNLLNQFSVPTNFPAQLLGFFDHDHTLAVSYTGNDDIDEWDISTGKKVHSWQGENNWSRVSFSEDGQLCLTYRSDDTALLRNLANGHHAQFKLNAKGEASGVRFSPDGKLLAVTSMFGYAKLFGLDPPQELATLRGFLMGVHSVDFSPDGTRLALGSNGREAVKLWDVASLQELVTLGAEGSLFYITRFSPDGNVLGSSNSSGILYLWRAPSWAEIHAAEAQDKMLAQQP